MSILVTGGAGFIGSHTCVELLEAGEDIVVMDNFYNSNPKALEGIRKITGKDFRFYEADMLDISMLEAAGTGICMINGTEDTKKAADYITEADNNHNGFLEVLRLATTTN